MSALLDQFQSQQTPGFQPFGSPINFTPPSWTSSPLIQSVNGPNAGYPSTLSMQNMQLNPQQQFRINQAASDIARMRAAQGSAQYRVAGQNAGFNLDQQYGRGLASNAMTNLGMNMNLMNANTDYNNMQQNDAMQMANGFISPLMQMMLSYGGIGGGQ